MPPSLKPLARQTIVITGATSGHGLATAKRAAAQGARVLLVARDEDALRAVRDEIRSAGGSAEYVVADVGKEEDVDRVARFAEDMLGGFDTWVNNAGTGIYGEAMEVPMEDHRRLFDTNYFGMVHGSRAAVRHLRDRPGGGALINVGSINSDIPSPILSAYNASKHAVKGFTDSLRLELIGGDAPVSVTLIKPSAIGTPFPEHGRNLTGKEARLPPPIYSPELVADAILDAAQTPRRSVTVGGAGKLQVIAAAVAPALFDLVASRMDAFLVDKSSPLGRKPGNLFAPQGNDGRAEGRLHGRRASLYTAARTHMALTLGAAMTLGAGIAWAARRHARA